MDHLDRYIRLDAAGFLPGPGESAAEFDCRVKAVEEAHRQFESELSNGDDVVVFEGIRVNDAERIPPEIISEAEEVTSNLYDFRVRHVPGFFLSRDVGLLWGGCLITDTELPLSLFLIRGAFRNRSSWLFYDRRELLAHELCHSMRQSLHDVPLEEFFAYQTSPSRLRRYLGNCFIRDYDALLFVVPALILLAAQLCESFWLPRMPVWPFWLLAVAYPLYLLYRNAAARRIVFRAAKKLRAFGVAKPDAVLFRCTTPEIRELGELPDVVSFIEYTGRKADAQLRWQVIQRRFLTPEQQQEETNS